ncbi:dihydrolipoyl dehydrogenase [Acanthopleuribacter pedis]|uniref:Dihydrolipoyl dehydrogenase n=1 Tax=Acanthopleuribacter pedis TaxID=442870 RepID=A0A8J7U1L5_9BACT|nr:dihydrolipoyl dehydrogenase [Acanthopleuribacter pedis]MBO1317657.1 dihydrolipoyl dehydrogenase [Acanthopleuribacter pedis]
MSQEFDFVVIGSGPGGYVCAIRAAQLGLRTAIIERYGRLGGTCLNVGCIPSKALLQSSEHYHQAKHKFAKHGIDLAEVKLNLAQMMARKDEVVENLTSGIAGLMKKNKITHFEGHGSFVSAKEIAVKNGEETQTITGKTIVIATGSKPVELPFLPHDKKDIVSSTEALAFDAVPKHLVVVGGGVIGLEMGSVWLRLGAKVTVVEFMDRVLPPMDKDISKEMRKVLKKQGMAFNLSTGVTGVERAEDGTLIVKAKDKKDREVVLEADKVLVAVGRRPYTQGLGLENIGIETDKRGFIPVDDHLRTSVEGVYAIGDVIGGLMLAHKAEEEGVAVAEMAAGKPGHVNYNLVPNVVYTWPEVASVGKTEDELKEAGVAYNAGKFFFRANSRARCVDESDGFIKFLADKETDRLLGAHMVGPSVSELIQEAAVVMEFMGSSEDLARTCHGHPTLSETVKEAALAVDGRQIHS